MKIYLKLFRDHYFSCNSISHYIKDGIFTGYLIGGNDIIQVFRFEFLYSMIIPELKIYCNPVFKLFFQASGDQIRFIEFFLSISKVVAGAQERQDPRGVIAADHDHFQNFPFIFRKKPLRRSKTGLTISVLKIGFTLMGFSPVCAIPVSSEPTSFCGSFSAVVFCFCSGEFVINFP